MVGLQCKEREGKRDRERKRREYHLWHAINAIKNHCMLINYNDN